MFVIPTSMPKRIPGALRKACVLFDLCAIAVVGSFSFATSAQGRLSYLHRVQAAEQLERDYQGAEDDDKILASASGSPPTCSIIREVRFVLFEPDFATIRSRLKSAVPALTDRQGYKWRPELGMRPNTRGWDESPDLLDYAATYASKPVDPKGFGRYARVQVGVWKNTTFSGLHVTEVDLLRYSYYPTIRLWCHGGPCINFDPDSHSLVTFQDVRWLQEELTGIRAKGYVLESSDESLLSIETVAKKFLEVQQCLAEGKSLEFCRPSERFAVFPLKPDEIKHCDAPVYHRPE